MSFNKQLILKNVRAALRQAQDIVDVEDATYEEVKAAAVQANQAASELFKLSGIIAAESQIKQ